MYFGSVLLKHVDNKDDLLHLHLVTYFWSYHGAVAVMNLRYAAAYNLCDRTRAFPISGAPGTRELETNNFCLIVSVNGLQ
jgi:hypothetical protein